MTHTKGPWYIHTEKETGWFLVVGPKKENGKRDVVCNFPITRESTVNEANARLIAQAPAMLAFIESITDASGPYQDLNGHRIIADAYTIASKAKGEWHDR